MSSICRLSYDEAIRFCSEAGDFLRPCALCGVPNLDHPPRTKYTSSTTDASSYRLPSMDQFP